MPPSPGQNVVILGSTGSIGRSALSVIEHDGGTRLRAFGLAAHSSVDALVEQARKHRPRFAALTCADASERVDGQLRGTGVEFLTGRDGIIRMVQDEATDKVLSAIVGAAGLEGTWAALEAGKSVALANKETLVVAGPLIMELARSQEGRGDPAGRQRALGDLPGPPRRPRPKRGPPRDPDLLRRPVPRQDERSELDRASRASKP